MTSDIHLVRVDDGGEYLIMGDEADVSMALVDAELPPDRGVVVGPAVAFVRILGDEETEFVSVGYSYFDTLPRDQLQSLYDGWATVDHCQIRAASPLEIRSVEQEPIATITPGSGAYVVTVCRNPAVGDRYEHHQVLVWPDPRAGRLG